MQARTGSPATRSPRRAVALVAAVAAVLLAVPGSAGAATPTSPPHGMGLVPPTTTLPATTGLTDLAGAGVAGTRAGVAAALPESVDLTPYAPPPGDQGWHNACASWATAYTMAGWMANYVHHAGAPFSPMFVYNQVNDGSDLDGTSLLANFDVLEREGDVEASRWTHPFEDYLSQPTADELANAAQHRMTPSTVLFLGEGQGPAARTAIETAIAADRPVVLGVPVYDRFFHLGPGDATFGQADATGPVEGYHAVTVLGYDADGVRIENSWSDWWGDGGFATLSWEFVEAQAIEGIASGTFVANARTPEVTGLSATTVSGEGGSSLTITATNLDTVGPDTGNPFAAPAVRLVAVDGPEAWSDAHVVARTATTLRITVPPLQHQGRYRVVVTGSDGPSAPNGTADVVTAVWPFGVDLVWGEAGHSDAATWVTLHGWGFGTTAAGFRANRVTATVQGAPAPVRWIDDTQLQVSVPPAPAGRKASVVVLHSGIPSAPVSVPYLPPAPVVTAVRPARLPVSGNRQVTATVRNAAGISSVVLVPASDPAAGTEVPISSRTATTVTFWAPPSRSGRTQDLHVVVTANGGHSASTAADVLGYRRPLSVRPATAVVPAAGGSLTLTGTGFGRSAASFTAAHVTATVGGRAARLSWVSDTRLTVTVPAGHPGAAASVVLSHDTVAGPPATVRYAAVITRTGAPSGPRSGWTTAVTGVGLTRAGGWALLDSAGRTVRVLPVVASRTALSAARGGAVLLGSSTTATVRLPALPAGSYRLRFRPDQRTYPGAAFVPSSQAVVVYRAG